MQTTQRKSIPNHMQAMLRPVHVDVWYGQLAEHLLTFGDFHGDRTGVGTYSITGGSVRFDLADRFPAVTLKKTNLDWSFDEMSFFLKGDCSNISWLQERGVPIWDKFADAEGNVGPIYGCQWRHYQVPSKHDGILRQQPREIDQLAVLINDLKTDPWSRRMIVEGWNPALLPDTRYQPSEQAAMGKMSLPPCHKSFQCKVRNQGNPTLDLILYLRSSDSFLGLPFNIAQYAFLTHALARHVGMNVGHLVIHFGDLHLYSNHTDAVKTLIGRAHKQTFLYKKDEDELPAPQLVWDGTAPTEPWAIDARKHLFINHYFPQGYLAGDIAV